MMALVVELAVALIREFKAAGDDARKQEDALMAAEEKLSRLRAKAKFG